MRNKVEYDYPASGFDGGIRHLKTWEDHLYFSMKGGSPLLLPEDKRLTLYDLLASASEKDMEWEWNVGHHRVAIRQPEL